MMNEVFHPPCVMITAWLPLFKQQSHMPIRILPKVITSPKYKKVVMHDAVMLV